MREDISFRPKLGYLVITLIGTVFICVMMVFLIVTMMDSNDMSGGELNGMISYIIIMYVACVCILIFPVVLFFVRIRYILKENVLVIRRYFKTVEIYYTSIKSVEEVVDRSIFLFNFTPSVASSKQVWITYTDINGREGMVNISPAKKQEFLSALRSRIKDPEVFAPGGEKKASVKYQSWKALSPTKKSLYIAYVVGLIIIFVVIRVIR
ncbi:hypothetical protein Mpt1_c07560 [Candidatus Methanoplasma termitum]|uniref:Uncharacterized protein YyaB-like PH domain-containing protein n=1 Tax=Candidatus Methanoplasma termitum TaxID=1577791 RepID=A0A0A7LC62_9ARCH|nr:PH domain-containing protein [Candidatus Methanoplasma termitum]AIZ56639.1 hypothetical protein Mpt1_c07560 [Candidatus Methanoplasma termitum]